MKKNRKDQKIKDWKFQRLGSLMSIKRGGSPRPIEQYLTEDKDGLNWLKIGDIPKEAKYITKTSKKIRREGLNKTTLVKKGDFILSNSMSFGRPYILAIDTCIHDGWLTFQNIKAELLVKEFLYFLLLHPKTQNIFMSISAGSGVRNLKKETVAEVQLLLPPISEQNRIVTILQTWDQAIEKLKKKIELKKNIKRGLMQQLLTGKRRLAGFSGEWEIKPIRDFAKTASGGTPKSSEKMYYLNGDIPWLKSGEVRQGNITRFKNFITSKGLSNSSAKLFPKNTVLVAMYGATAGQVGILRSEAATNQALCAILPKSSFCHEFLFYYLYTKTNKLIELSTGAAQPNISQEIIKDFLVPFPNIHEQKAIAKIITNSNTELEKLNLKLNLLNNQKTHLLNTLITGKIRTPDNLLEKVA